MPEPLDPVDAMAAAIMEQMRRDIGRVANWETEPEQNKRAWRNAAIAALAALARTALRPHTR